MSGIRTIKAPVPLDELRKLAAERFGDMVKAVVDVRRGIMAVAGEMHADEEAVLLEDGSAQTDLWGINLYPDKGPADRIKFDSMINIRPSQGNRSRNVEDPTIRERIMVVITKLII